MEQQLFRERFSTALKRQIDRNDPDIVTPEQLSRISGDYTKYTRGERGSPRGRLCMKLAFEAKIDWEKLIDPRIPIADVFQDEPSKAVDGPPQGLVVRSYADLSFSEDEIAQHLLRRVPQGIRSYDLAASGNLVERSCFEEIFQSLENGFGADGLPIINIHGAKGTGKSSILADLQVKLAKSQEYVVVEHPELKSANFDIVVRDLKEFILDGDGEKFVLFIDFQDVEPEEHFGSISALRDWMETFEARFKGDAVLVYSSVAPNVTQYDQVSPFGTSLTLEDELNLFNYLSRFLANSRVVVPDIQEFWRRTGGRRNHGDVLQVFIDSYVWSSGERSEFLDQIRSTPHEFSLLKYVATSQLLDLPMPSKMLSRFSGPGVKSIIQLEAELPGFIQRMQIHDDSVHGVKFDSIIAGIEVMRALNSGSHSDLLHILKEISDCCQTYMDSSYDVEVARYYRLVLHRLAKGRGIGSADLNGGKVIAEVLPSLLDTVADKIFFHTQDVDELCEWIGTLTMMGRHIFKKDLSQKLTAVAITNLSEVVSSVDVADVSPRSFTSLSASVSRLKSGKLTLPQKEQLLNIVRLFVEKLNFSNVLLKDYERNRNWNWRSRLGTSIHTYALLLKTYADLVPKHLNLSTEEGTLARKRAISVIEQYQDFLPVGVIMDQTAASRLLRAQLLQEFDMDAARSAFQELLPIPERDVRDGPENSITVVRAFIDFHLEHGGLDEHEIDEAVDELVDIASQAIDFLSPNVVKNVASFFIAWKLDRKTASGIASTLSALKLLCYTTSSLEKRLMIEGNLIIVVQVLTDEARYPPFVSGDHAAGSGETADRAVVALNLALGLVKYCSTEFTLPPRTRRTISNLLWGMGRLKAANPDYATELAAVGEILAA